jgi:type IV pilus assembly protein PilW
MHRFRDNIVQPMRRLYRMQGMSIVEFMIAVTIGTFITLGILILMSRTSRSYKIDDEYSRMQEAGTSALNYLGNDIHMAGFFGLAITSDAINTLDVNPADGKLDYNVQAGAAFVGTNAAGAPTLADCGPANWSFQPAQPVFGYPPTTTPGQANAALPCIPVTNFVTGPILILRGASGQLINTVANGTGAPAAPTANQIDPNALYLQSDPANGYVFQGVDYVPNFQAKQLNRMVPNGAGGFVDAPIFPYQSNIYYIRPCSRPTGGVDGFGNPTCQGIGLDDAPNPDPIPTLVRQQWQSTPAGPALNEVALVEGVEAFNVIYGLDAYTTTGQLVPAGCNTPTACATPPDGVADVYTTVVPSPLVAIPAVNQWSEVVAIKIYLLVRSTAPSAGYNDASKTYDLGGGVTFNCNNVVGTQPDACNYHRHLFSQVFEVRNVAFRR